MAGALAIAIVAALIGSVAQRTAAAASTGGVRHTYSSLRARSVPQPPAYDCPRQSDAVRSAAPGRGKTVALTFDDGPGASTAALIDILLHRHVTATFFNLGMREPANSTKVRTESRDGFALGDHTWDHRDLTGLDAAGQAREMDTARRRNASLTGHYTCLLRPPFGKYDGTTIRLARARHLAVWTWSVDTEDWKAAGSSAASWVNRIVARAEAGGTQNHPVVLMHNQTGGNPATVLALPRIIRYYRTHGYRFVDLNGNTGRPVVSAMSVSSGSVRGGYSLVLRGTNFRRVTAVRFGAVAGRGVAVTSATRLRVTVPAHRSGTVTVTVQTADHGDSAASAVVRFRFVAPAA
jgi:peptidoglycan/xylan/chitin deacetylase (PgdA/CDA1 family)